MSDNWRNNLNKELKSAPDAIKNFIEVVAKLRHPDEGCPWDIKQDHRSLRPFMIEEAYEAAEAMASDDKDHIREELGDVLLQVVLNSQLLSDAGEDGFTSVVEGIASKMVRRHPHVFQEGQGGIDVAEVKRNWQKIKDEEKKSKSVKLGGRVFLEEQKARVPALMQAIRIGKKAKKIRFDWPNLEEVWGQFISEISELEEEVQCDTPNIERILDEVGDVFFTLSQVCRHLGIDPEVAASQGNQKFLRRFSIMEDLAESKQLEILSMDTAELEGLWKEAKKQEKAAK